jgi:cellulose synthase (UDP-forming)
MLPTTTRMTGEALRQTQAMMVAEALPPASPLARLFTMLLGTAAAGLLGLVIITPLEMQAQAILAAILFAFALLLSRWKGRFVTLCLVALSVTTSSRYLWWRLTATLSAEPGLDAVLGFVLLGAELYAYLVLLLGYFQLLEPLRRKPIRMTAPLAHWPSIDVYIPSYNEPLEVVRATVLAAKAMDWPADRLNVYLLDDGRRPEFRAFAARAGVSYLIRPDNAHAKAGNLNHALGKSQGEYVAIFDCDHVPARSFLQMTVGMLVEDPRLAMVQTPHHFYSPDPFERNLKTFRSIPNEGELFYSLIQPGNDLWDATFFCGSCAVLRRSALEEVGGIAVETVTEDAHTMLKLHRSGHSSAFLDMPLAAGLATESLSAHVGQRIRWARGMAQIFRLDNPFLGRGLTLAQRLCYASSMLHFFYGLPRLIFLLSPLSFLLFGAQIFNALPLLVLSYSLPHLLHALVTNSRVQRTSRHSFWSEVYETVLAFYVMIPTTVALIAPRRGTFNVTAKGGLVERPFFNLKIAVPTIVLTVLNLGGLVAGILRLALDPHPQVDVVVMNMVWTGYNLMILGATLAVAWEHRQVRTAPRVSVALPALVRLPSGHLLRGRTRDLSMSGAAVQLAGEALPAGDAVTVTVVAGRGERAIPAEVVAHDQGLLRLRWGQLDAESEAALVEVLFCRADAWLSWKDGRRPDSLPRALADIVVHAGRAFARVVLPALRPARGKEVSS